MTPLKNVKPEPRLPQPDARLRGVGLSGRKVEYVKDLARHSLDGSLPVEALHTLAKRQSLPDLALEGAPGRAVWRPHGVMAVIGPSNYPIHLMSTQHGQVFDSSGARLLELIGRGGEKELIARPDGGIFARPGAPHLLLRG